MATSSRRVAPADGGEVGPFIKALPAAKKPSAEPSPYHLRISRLTVDKLGVKLHEKASAVVAELVAIGYDADAETVTVRLPLNIQLSRQDFLTRAKKVHEQFLDTHDLGAQKRLGKRA